MPDFRLAFTDGATLETWNDPADVARPSRLNPVNGRDPKRWVAQVGVEVELTATVDGVAAPMDATLDSRLFLPTFAEYPTALPPPVTSPAGQSSVMRFTPATTGHYCLAVHRELGGAVFAHIDVVSSG